MTSHSPPSGDARRASDAAAPAGVGLVIFDFDGVVADSEVISLSSLQGALRDYGIDLTLDGVRDRYLGVGLDKINVDVARQNPDSGSDGFSALWHSSLYDMFRRDLRPVPGLIDLLDRLEARGMLYCIASSGSLERIGVALEAMGLTERFAHVFSAEQVDNGKPAPDLFLHAANELGVAPDRCVVIEDSPFGIKAAKAAGMQAIGFLGGAHLAEIRGHHRRKLLAQEADGIVEALSDIMAV